MFKTLGLITYDTPHLKTEQVLTGLLSKYDPKQFKFYALPFEARKPRTILKSHRPDQTASIHPQILAETHKIPYVSVEHDWEIPNDCEYFLILGAGLLSERFISGKQVINCHPGIIPAVRGLDAFKWAIYDMKSLGITLHFIDKHVDAGEVISIIPTDVYKTDTFETLARRHYENEILAMCHFEYHLKTRTNIFLGIPEGESRRRMSTKDEMLMEGKFGDYVEQFSIIKSSI